jgi:hypothetical protein
MLVRNNLVVDDQHETDEHVEGNQTSEEDQSSLADGHGEWQVRR